MILAPGVRVSGPLFIVSSVHSDLDSLFLDFVFVEISFDLSDFSIVGSARNRVFSGGFRKIACLDAI